jgi:hypothetical protein
MKAIKISIGLLLFFLAGGAFFWNADHLIAQSEKKYEHAPFRTDVNRIEIREHRFRPILRMDFTARSPGLTKSTLITLGATTVRKVSNIEWLGSVAVLITLESSYGSVGNYESNRAFHDFESGQFATTMDGSLTPEEFSQMIGEWKARHGNKGAPVVNANF